MRKKVLHGKWILTVSTDQHALAELATELDAHHAHPDMALSFDAARQKLLCLTYDAVILDAAMERFAELLELAAWRVVPTVVTGKATEKTIDRSSFNRTPFPVVAAKDYAVITLLERLAGDLLHIRERV